jgi:hypothetical protein
MSGEENQASNPNSAGDRDRAVKHEGEDINVWAVVKFGIGLLILGIVSYIGQYAMLKVFEHERLASEAAPPPMARGAEDRLPPPPRLQMMPGSASEFKTPDYEMRAMVEDEDKTLASYGWVNKNSSIVRIPIDEAMKLILEKGLPSKPSAAAVAGTELRQGTGSARATAPTKE